MTRYEEIAKKANELCNDPNNDFKSTEDLCIMMAEWADEHPDLYRVTRKAAEREREYMINKFCKFMQSCEGYVVSGEKCNYDNFIKFMEEQK